MKMESAAERNVPVPPSLPMSTPSTSYGDRSSLSWGAMSAAQDSWDRLFDDAYRADVEIRTDGNGLIYAHASILGTASPVMKGVLKQSRKTGRDNRRKSISILGVPQEAVRVFIRFLYSSRYEKEDMEEFGLNLLVLSHVYVVPRLKAECERSLESPISLNVENVVDVFQLALLCDAPRLGLICHRMIVRGLKSVEATDGWTAMKESHPILEKSILESAAEETNRKNEAMRRRKERKVYLQLRDAMEALVHICRDGCKTIGPQGKELKESHETCRFSEACKGLESLVRHLAGCKLRAPGGCVHCKRMWQLLELHSRLCAHSNSCNVPLCRKFKEKIKKQSKKEEIKWKVLVKRILRANATSGRPFFSWADPISC